jgi:hypothetical protein
VVGLEDSKRLMDDIPNKIKNLICHHNKIYNKYEHPRLHNQHKIH